MNRTGFVQPKRMGIDFDDLFQARPENVVRLARWLGIQADGRKHADLCRDVVRWYKKNPQPKPKNR